MEHVELSLIEEFASEHPIYTTKVLEFISVQDLLYVLQNIDLRVSARILEIMSPRNSLELISRFSEDNQIDILKYIGPEHLISILRFLDKKEQTKYIKNLSYLERSRVELQLKYELDEVGAWMCSNVPQVNRDYSLKDLKNYLDEFYENEQFKEVFVIDTDCFLEGVLSLDKIILSSDNIKVGSLAKTMKYTLSPRLKLNVVQNHIGFMKFDRLPVVSKKNKILGVFSYVDLKKGLSYGKATGMMLEDELTEGYGIYGDTLLGLLNIK